MNYELRTAFKRKGRREGKQELRVFGYMKNIRNTADNIPIWRDNRNNAVISRYLKPDLIERRDEIENIPVE
ncbi:MAG: hypothetical protein AB1393_00870 [Candidatus Edwardsbacteria bacterium]